MMDSREKDEPITIKVTRLMKPSLFTSLAVNCDNRDLPGELFNIATQSDVAFSKGLPLTGIGQMMLLPQSFGLVCSVSYQGPNGDQQSFRKFFKFQVMKPLDVKTKFYNAESDEVYLEAGVQNITSNPICLEKVELEPPPYYNVTSLCSVNNEENTSVFGHVNVLNSQDIRQYLYCLTPKPEARKTIRQTTYIGKLDIVWRTNFGDKGRLQTSQLQRMVPPYGDIQVTVEEIPNFVSIEESFTITVLISNICERNLDLHLDFINGKEQNIIWHCVNSRDLPQLASAGSHRISLCLLPLSLGLQTVAGIRITDKFLKRSYDYENLAQVFVSSKKSEKQQKFFTDWIGDFYKIT